MLCEHLLTWYIIEVTFNHVFCFYFPPPFLSILDGEAFGMPPTCFCIIKRRYFSEVENQIAHKHTIPNVHCIELAFHAQNFLVQELGVEFYGHFQVSIYAI